MVQLVGYFLLLSLLAGSLAVLVAYAQARAALEQSIFDRLTAAATLKENELNRWVQDQRDVVVSISRLPDVQAQAALLLEHANDAAQIEVLPVNSLAFSPDGRWLATAGGDDTVRVWDALTGELAARFAPQLPLHMVRFSPDGRLIAAASDEDFSVRVWGTASQQELARLVHQAAVVCYDFDPGGRLLATGTANGVLSVWDVGTGRQLVEARGLVRLSQLKFGPGGDWLATASDDYTLRVWNAATGEFSTRIKYDNVLTLDVSPDGRWLAAGSQDHTAQVWDTASGEQVAVLRHDGPVQSVRFSPDGGWLATAGDDTVIRLWQLPTGTLAKQLTQWEFGVLDVAFAPDGKRLLSRQAGSGTALVWDLDSGKVVARLVHTATVTDAAFSPDGQRAATTSQDGTARMWDLATGQALFRVEHDSRPYAFLSQSLAAMIDSQPDLEEIIVLAANGDIVVSTDKRHEGQSQLDVGYFARAQAGTCVQNVYVSQLVEKPAITIATPFHDKTGQVSGVLAAHLDLKRVDAILAERSGLGRTGQTYLVDAGYHLVGAEGLGTPGFPQAIHSLGIDAAVQGTDGLGVYENYAGVPVVGVYRWLDELDLALLAEMDASEAFAPARQLAGVTGLVGLAMACLMGVGVYFIARQIARPILAVADAAASVEAGDFEIEGLTGVSRRADEVGLLARVFQRMAREVRAREQLLKKQLQNLRIEIDEIQRQRQVKEIVDTDFFQDLQAKVRRLRGRRSSGTPQAREEKEP